MKKIIFFVLIALIFTNKSYASTDWALNLSGKTLVCDINKKAKNSEHTYKTTIKYLFKLVEIEHFSNTFVLRATEKDGIYRKISDDGRKYMIFDSNNLTLTVKETSTKKVTYNVKFYNCIDSDNLD